MTASVVIVYHSGFGHTEAIAESVAMGVRAGGATCEVISVEQLPSPDKGEPTGKPWDALHGADAIVFGSPTYMGTVSAPFKAFMDASSAFWGTQKWKDKLAAGFTNGGGLSGDKLHTLTTLSIFAAQHGMHWINPGFGVSEPDGINRMSSSTGLMTQAENAPPDQSPPECDHATARVFGERVAQVSMRWVRGRSTQ